MSLVESLCLFIIELEDTNKHSDEVVTDLEECVDDNHDYAEVTNLEEKAR